MRRVVVTGMGIACPLGLGVEHVWKRLLNGDSGIGTIQSFDTSELPAKVAGQIPAGAYAEWMPYQKAVAAGQVPPTLHATEEAKA